MRALFAKLDAEFGRIDFLGNVAGESIMAPPEEIRLEDVEQVWRNLVLGRFCACQEAGRRMLAAGRGSIVNIGSLASVTALGRGHIAYSMAMGAVAQMTRELSTEWAGSGVRVNAILPAQVLNPGLEKRIAEMPSLRDQFLSGIPAGRLGRPDDIKGLAVLLASDCLRMDHRRADPDGWRQSGAERRRIGAAYAQRRAVNEPGLPISLSHHAVDSHGGGATRTMSCARLDSWRLPHLCRPGGNGHRRVFASSCR